MIDASVAAKWYLPEPDAEAARLIMSGEEPLRAPEIIRVEVVAAILRRHRTGGIVAADALRSCSAWQSAIDNQVLLLSPNEDDRDRAIGLAVEIKHQFQDCLYLALALRLGAVLVTADPRFVTRSLGVYPNVRALATGQ